MRSILEAKFVASNWHWVEYLFFIYDPVKLLVGLFLLLIPSYNKIPPVLFLLVNLLIYIEGEIWSWSKTADPVAVIVASWFICTFNFELQ